MEAEPVRGKCTIRTLGVLEVISVRVENITKLSPEEALTLLDDDFDALETDYGVLGA